jgi:hypothetical protein
MPITISGSGTIDGLSAGGLPDSCITTAEIAAGAVTQAKRSEQLTVETAKAYNWNGLTTNTLIEYTSIPSWVKRITLLLDGVSTSSTGVLTVRIGTASGIENTGYTSVVSNVATSTVGTQSGVVSGFELVTTGLATYTYAGQYVLTNITGNTWVLTGSLHVGGVTTSQQFISGRKAVASILTRIQLTTTGGTDFFDGGSINIVYE